MFRLTSPEFNDRGPMPRKYTCDGEDVSPPLQWSDAPKGTKSYALVCDDPDAPVMTWIHWVAYDIPGASAGLSEDMPRKNLLTDGTKQGRNSWLKVGYGGPCPPRGKPHRYFFRLYALDSILDLAPGADRKTLMVATEGLVLAKAEIVGTYGRAGS
jgi:hypothetical protein